MRTIILCLIGAAIVTITAHFVYSYQETHAPPDSSLKGN